MSYLHEELRQHPDRGKLTGLWQGVITAGAQSLSDLVDVRIPAFSTRQNFAGCRWQSRDDHSTPDRGDVCLGGFDDRGELWVIAWWPFEEVEG